MTTLLLDFQFQTVPTTLKRRARHLDHLELFGTHNLKGVSSFDFQFDLTVPNIVQNDDTSFPHVNRLPDCYFPDPDK
jgi:hypothetical protein